MKKLLSLALILVFTTIAFGQATTPEAAAKNLFDAWKAKDKAEASKFATAKVINIIWTENISEYEYEVCNKYGGQMHCFYRHESGGSINLTMTKIGKNWKAKSVILVFE